MKSSLFFIDLRAYVNSVRTNEKMIECKSYVREICVEESYPLLLLNKSMTSNYNIECQLVNYADFVIDSISFNFVRICKCNLKLIY